MCSLHFSFAVLPEKASCPISAACSGVGTLPGLRDILGLLTKWFSKKTVLKKVQEKAVSAIKSAKTGQENQSLFSK
ncbi:hypothetical protein DW141_10110 [Ruminococcus sp. AM12-48]|nr:hypothetical protein DW141_10110 [Ruminococcus sp. AM12-48]